MGFIKDSIEKQKGFVATIHRKERANKILLWLNWFWCYLRYGATPSDWYCYEMYKYRHLHLRNIITRRKNILLDKIFNPREFQDDFDNKLRFNLQYKDFVKRRWFVYPQMKIAEIQKSKPGGGNCSQTFESFVGQRDIYV